MIGVQCYTSQYIRKSSYGGCCYTACQVAVVGSITPWVEAIILNHGAQHVTTVEYNSPSCAHPRLQMVGWPSFAESEQADGGMYDAVVTYSSIEHAGLGRCGAPLSQPCHAVHRHNLAYPPST